MDFAVYYLKCGKNMTNAVAVDLVGGIATDVQNCEYNHRRLHTI
jgi:hypothetical protein